MNKLTPLAAVLMVSLLVILVGCDDDLNNTTRQDNGTNSSQYNYRCMAPAGTILGGTTITLNDGSNRFPVLVVDASTYMASLQPNTEQQTGTYTFTPSGDAATIVLTPANSNNITSTINLLFTSPTGGTYASDSLGNGTFTMDQPLSPGC